MPGGESRRGALRWIGTGVAIVVLVLLFAAMQWNYLPRNWRGFAWLAFVGVPVWLAFEWMSDAVQEKVQGRSRWLQGFAILAVIGVVALIIWLMPAAPH